MKLHTGVFNRVTRTSIAFLSVLLLSQCDPAGNLTTHFDKDVPPVTLGSWRKPSILDTWDYRLQGAIDNRHGVQVLDVDLFDLSATDIATLKTGSYVVCYFSAGSYENWRSDKDDFPSESLGNNLDGWPGEKWLDIRLKAVGDIMLARLDLAATKGCDAVEPDNVDGYQNNSGFPLTANDQLAYNRFIANAARNRGLAVGLKNNLDQIAELVDYYDFAVNEECYTYDECNLLTPFINSNKPVFHVEYESALRAPSAAFDAMCASTGRTGLRFSTVVLPLDLDASFYNKCP